MISRLGIRTGLRQLLGVIYLLLGVAMPLVAEEQADDLAAFKQGTPAEAFESVCAAIQKDDWKAALSGWTKDSSDLFVGNLLIGAGSGRLGSQGADLVREFADELVLEPITVEALRKMQEGDAWRKLTPKAAALVDDKPGFLRKFMAKFSDQRVFKEAWFKNSDKIKLVDLQIDGDKAKCAMEYTVGNRNRREPMLFRKIDGRWYLHNEG